MPVREPESPAVLDALGADALVDDGTDAVLRISLPWIRSLPVAAVRDVEVRIDGARIPSPRAILGDRMVAVDDLGVEPGWWFVQDRLALRLGRAVDAGSHAVRLSFHLAVPYLQVGPDGPLILPFLFERDLVAGAPVSAVGITRDVA